jgi:hypothetical protein
MIFILNWSYVAFILTFMVLFMSHFAIFAAFILTLLHYFRGAVILFFLTGWCGMWDVMVVQLQASADLWLQNCTFVPFGQVCKGSGACSYTLFYMKMFALLITQKSEFHFWNGSVSKVHLRNILQAYRVSEDFTLLPCHKSFMNFIPSPSVQFSILPLCELLELPMIVIWHFCFNVWLSDCKGEWV